jgi:hypothetical protein
MNNLDPDLLQRFHQAVLALQDQIPDASTRATDERVCHELRQWLDGDGTPIDWECPYPEVTCDEWFFITTLSGEMKPAAQRTHVRKFYPTLFVGGAQRDIRNFRIDLAGYDGLRASWMEPRLCMMAAVLRERGLTMGQYTDCLRGIEARATPDKPTPALDAIVRDHRATSWKTLSVFVRDCVGGNCFPIDARVEKELKLRRLPVNERLLVRLSLATDNNPRVVARMFYDAGGVSGQENRGPRRKRTRAARPVAPGDAGDRVTHFVRDDAGYLAWLESHPTGFVVHCRRKPTPDYLVLHRATCYHIGRPAGGTKTHGGFRKVCADTEQDLRDWAATMGGDLIRRCYCTG